VFFLIFFYSVELRYNHSQIIQFFSLFKAWIRGVIDKKYLDFYTNHHYHEIFDTITHYARDSSMKKTILSWRNSLKLLTRDFAGVKQKFFEIE